MLQAQLFASAGSDLGGGRWAENSPTGLPTNVREYVINEGTGEIGVQWANGDPTAWTQIGYNASGEPTSTTMLVAPGVTSWETGTSDANGWWVRHTRGGTPGDWVAAQGF